MFPHCALLSGAQEAGKHSSIESQIMFPHCARYFQVHKKLGNTDLLKAKLCSSLRVLLSGAQEAGKH